MFWREKIKNLFINLAEYACIMSFCLYQNHATVQSKENAMEKYRIPVVTRNIAVVGFEGSEILDIVGPLEVFAMADFLLKTQDASYEPAYQSYILARKKGVFSTFSGVKLTADCAWKDFSKPIDTLFVAGGPDVSPLADDREFLNWLCGMEKQVRRFCSVCTGSLVLARAGLLDGKRATTHWVALQGMKADYPEIVVDCDALFIRDGHIATSAGITSGMDLALALVEEDYGKKLSLDVARMLVLYLKRPGGQSQFSVQLRQQIAQDSPMACILKWIAENYRGSVTIEKLAGQAAMSPRNFARVFVRETGVTPARYVEQCRLEHAIRLLEDKEDPVETLARESGFNSAEHLRRACMRYLGITPQAYRDRFQSTC
jgi:transcriptional regulator GlxA family with amidase domain